jgi:hypothetical protein
VYAIYEQNRIICFQTAVQPLLNVFPKVIQYPRYARLAVVFSLYGIEHIPNLFLRQAFAVQRSGC